MGKMKEIFMKEREIQELPYFIDGEVIKYILRNKNYDTEVTVRFREDGYPMSVQHKVEAIINENQHKENQLNNLISQAVKNKDFKAAESLQKQLDRLESF